MSTAEGDAPCSADTTLPLPSVNRHQLPLFKLPLRTRAAKPTLRSCPNSLRSAKPTNDTRCMRCMPGARQGTAGTERPIATAGPGSSGVSSFPRSSRFPPPPPLLPLTPSFPFFWPSPGRHRPKSRAGKTESVQASRDELTQLSPHAAAFNQTQAILLSAVPASFSLSLIHI